MRREEKDRDATPGWFSRLLGDAGVERPDLGRLPASAESELTQGQCASKPKKPTSKKALKAARQKRARLEAPKRHQAWLDQRQAIEERAKEDRPPPLANPPQFFGSLEPSTPDD